MKIKTLLITLLSITLFSCYDKKEYAYNEVMANYYFSVSDQFENVYKKFYNGGFETKYENKDSGREFFFDSNISDIKKSKKNTANTINLVKEQKPSEAAKKFHNITLQYMKIIETDFSDALKAYTNINCECPRQKDSLRSIVDNIYNKISNTEDKIQQVQLEYMNKTGFKPEQKKDR